MESVAALPWNQRQPSNGIGGRLAMESVAALPWNQWQDSPGIGGSFAVEYAFLAAPTVLGVIDTYGIELIHPMREGRSPQQIGRKGLSNHRWIVGGKLCLLLNQYGLVVAWACDTANVADNTFQWLIRQFEERMIILSDTGFHAAEGDPSNLKLCQRGEWEERMLVETVLSMLTLVCHFKKVMHRVWEYFQARLAFTMAAFNVLVQWHGLRPNAAGFVPLSMAEFSL
jgi:hypothetical protein